MINNTNRFGVSLTELLIVVLVAAVSLVPIFGLISGNSRSVSFNQDRATAQVLATQIIERFRHQQYKQLKTDFLSYESGSTTIVSDDVLAMLLLGLPEKDERLYRKFKREAIFVEEIPGLLGQFMVRVTWQNNQNKDSAVKMATMIRNVEFHDGKPL